MTEWVLVGGELRPHALVWIVPAALSGIAIAPLPYGYYLFLRVVVSAACAYLAWAENQERGASAWAAALVIGAVVFNPILPIHLFKEGWMVLNLAVAVLLVFHMVAWRRREKS